MYNNPMAIFTPETAVGFFHQYSGGINGIDVVRDPKSSPNLDVKNNFSSAQNFLQQWNTNRNIPNPYQLMPLMRLQREFVFSQTPTPSDFEDFKKVFEAKINNDNGRRGLGREIGTALLNNSPSALLKNLNIAKQLGLSILGVGDEIVSEEIMKQIGYKEGLPHNQQEQGLHQLLRGLYRIVSP